MPSQLDPRVTSVQESLHTLRGRIAASLRFQAQPTLDRAEGLLPDLPQAPDVEAVIVAVADGADASALDEVAAAEIAYEQVIRSHQIKARAAAMVRYRAERMQRAEDRILERVDILVSAILRTASQVIALTLEGRDAGLVITTMNANMDALRQLLEGLVERHDVGLEAGQVLEDLQALIDDATAARRIA